MPPRSNTSRVAVTDVPGATPGTLRVLELRRPEKLNCLSLQMLDELWSALQGTQARTLVLAGEGRAFCTGLDLKEVAGPHGGQEHLRRLIAIYRWLLKTKVRTVVLARGYAVGGGAGLLACAKTVIVSSDFRFRLPGGDLSRLASVVIPVCNLRTGGKQPGPAGWLGCDLDAAQAHRLGLVDKVLSPEFLEEMLERARSGTLEPERLQETKRDKNALSRADSELEQYLRLLGER